jgi:hypothetical protein
MMKHQLKRGTDDFPRQSVRPDGQPYIEFTPPREAFTRWKEDIKRIWEGSFGSTFTLNELSDRRVS